MSVLAGFNVFPNKSNNQTISIVSATIVLRSPKTDGLTILYIHVSVLIVSSLFPKKFKSV